MYGLLLSNLFRLQTGNRHKGKKTEQKKKASMKSQKVYIELLEY